MKNENMIAKFYEMVRDLYDLGSEIMDTCEDDDRKSIVEASEEVDCMMTHCKCCMSFLEKAMQIDFPKFGK